MDTRYYATIRNWLFLAFLVLLLIWVIGSANHALQSNLEAIPIPQPTSDSWLTRFFHAWNVQAQTQNAHLIYGMRVFFGAILSPIAAWLLSMLCARPFSAILGHMIEARTERIRQRRGRIQLAQERDRLQRLTLQSDKLQREQDAIAGRQLLTEHLKSIRRTLGYLAAGQDQRIGTESINEYLDKIHAESRISRAIKRDPQIRADVALLLTELKRLKLHKHLVGQRMKQTFS